jgi:hypothetical protein
MQTDAAMLDAPGRGGMDTGAPGFSVTLPVFSLILHDPLRLARKPPISIRIMTIDPMLSNRDVLLILTVLYIRDSILCPFSFGYPTSVFRSSIRFCRGFFFSVYFPIWMC